MQKRVFKIESNAPVARDTFRIVLRTDGPVCVRSGQFVDIAVPGFYLRRPVSVSDCLPDGAVLYYKVVGEGTRDLSGMAPGSALELLEPLGSGFRPEKCREAALLIGGASVYREAMPLADRLCLTLVHDTPVEADAFFPEVEPEEWSVEHEERHEADERHAFAYTFIDYARHSFTAN